jgi:hypothetical protein
MSQPVEYTYNPLCYPLDRENFYKKERTKNIIILSIAIAFILLVNCSAVLLTHLFAPNFFQVAMSFSGIAIGYIYTFLLSSCLSKIECLDKKIEKERYIIKTSNLSFPKNDDEAKQILLIRASRILSSIRLEEAKNLQTPFVAKRLRSIQKYAFLQHLHKEEKFKVNFNALYTFHFKNYNAGQLLEMVRDNENFPFYTKRSEDGETQVYWSQCFSKDPL